ncbi:hypothetical protein CHLNCDRAFT_136366 [Chlorella variabilis]|uniref:CCHC-type domain-containing protein n=1 Tax=Chlorella variabilis TaxID=554065 RepID=E1ZK78_CHLVA|nr:hypothetical protein CHLNCDRAFT_136366 [Chlorella variabilis]EFN53647.1 hypothetical protein CHLNCDRAFT_136366 [Chlorella variabilis]|eukprot:XP_005845749.1 hypothetical protein CHLNCDRAFT_136366 [Chlorella variabilis]
MGAEGETEPSAPTIVRVQTAAAQGSRKKRKSEAARSPADAPVAEVNIQYEGLPPDSRLKLDEALRGWAEWHAAKYLPGYVPPEVVSGSLGYRPETMELAWEDKPAAPGVGPAETMWFNVKYEQAGGVPRYDRHTDNQLAYSNKKRPSDTLLAAEEAAAGAGGAGKPVKRLRSSNRCFNCGSYGHTMRECWREHNRELVEESKRHVGLSWRHAELAPRCGMEHAEARGPAYRSAPKRYYLEGAAEGGDGRRGLEQVEGEFAGLAPGVLSEDLRQALGIGPTAPPPWLQRMREMGLPPGYMAPVPAEADPPLAATGNGSSRPAAAAAPAADQPLEDFIALEASPPPEAGEEAGATPVKLECRVLFPGVNAPAPEGADAAAWAPPPPQRQPSLPPGFGEATPASYGTPAAERWQQRQPGSAEWGGSGGGSGGGRWQPMRGLHPPRHAASEGSLAAVRAEPATSQQQQVTPPRPAGPAYGASAPDAYQAAQPQQPAAQLLPPGFGQQYHAQQLYQQYQQQYQQAQQQQLQMLHHLQQQPAEAVYSISRSDPGHLLVFDQRGAGMPSHNPAYHQQQPHQQQVAPPQQQQYWALPQAHQQQQEYQRPAELPYQQQQYQQPAALPYQQQQYQHQGASPYDQQQQQQQQAYGAMQQHAEQPGGGGGGEGSGRAYQQQQQQQQMWLSNGRF